MTESTILILLKEWWHVISGLVLVGWFMLVRIKRALFSNHPTHAQLADCKSEVTVGLKRLLMEHEQTEFDRIDRIDEQNRKAHEGIEHRLDRLDDKISDTTSEIIAILRTSK